MGRRLFRPNPLLGCNCLGISDFQHIEPGGQVPGTFKLGAATSAAWLRHPVDIPRQLLKLSVGDFGGHVFSSKAAAYPRANS